MGLERSEKLSFNPESGRQSPRATLQDRHWHGGNTEEQGGKEAVQEDAGLLRFSSTGGSIRQPHVCLKWGRDRRRLLDAHPPSPDSLQQEGRNGAFETGDANPSSWGRSRRPSGRTWGAQTPQTPAGRARQAMRPPCSESPSPGPLPVNQDPKGAELRRDRPALPPASSSVPARGRKPSVPQRPHPRCPLTVLRLGVPAHQVVVPMLGPQHARHLLQAVQVRLLGAARREGHGDDALGDVGEVQLAAVLHGGAQPCRPGRHAGGGQERGEVPGQRKSRDIRSLFPPGPDHRHLGIYCAPSQEGTDLNFLNAHDWGTTSYEQGIHGGREARGSAAGLMESLQREGLSGRASVQRAWTLQGGAFLALGIRSGVGSRGEAH